MRLRNELLKLKHRVHPLLSALEELGLRTDVTVSEDPEDLPNNPNWIMHYPFPTTETLRTRQCYELTHHLQHCLISELIRSDPEYYGEFVKEWREAGERQLVNWWLRSDTSNESTETEELTDSIVTVRLSSPPLRTVLTNHFRFMGKLMQPMHYRSVLGFSCALIRYFPMRSRRMSTDKAPTTTILAYVDPKIPTLSNLSRLPWCQLVSLDI